MKKNCACEELHFEGVSKTQACELAVTYENLPKNAEIFALLYRLFAYFYTTPKLNKF